MVVVGRGVGFLFVVWGGGCREGDGVERGLQRGEGGVGEWVVGWGYERDVWGWGGESK